MLFIEDMDADGVCAWNIKSILHANCRVSSVIHNNSVHVGMYVSNIASYHAVGNFSTPPPTESVVLLLSTLISATLTYRPNLPHIQ